ncbi:MAG: sensor histidine kinase [Spirochaetales bacterium]|nr:sensor histidine kinase [Spirochaetales bacterium]
MEKKVRLVYGSLYALNLIIILFISLTICLTIYKINADGMARTFLEEARYLPHVAWKVPTYSILLFLVLGISEVLKLLFGKEDSLWLLYLYLLDLFLLTLISYSLNFSYNVIYLYIIAGLFLHPTGISMRLLILTLALGCFIIFDYDLFSVRVNLLSFKDYVDYHSPQRRIYLYSIKSILTSINLMMIILHFYILINSKIRENKEFIRLNDALKKNLRELNIANGKLEEAGRMKERNRLAHEIHDILGHSLTCISTGLEASLEVAGESPPLLLRQLRKIKKLSDKGLKDIRRSVNELKEDAIGGSSLIPSLKELVENINIPGRQKVMLSIEGKARVMDHDEELTIYRMIQESLTNSIRHGRAYRIVVVLYLKETEVSIEIQDNGSGADQIVEHFGLSHMKEQIAILGGSLAHQSRPGEGFYTKATIPLRSARSD